MSLNVSTTEHMASYDFTRVKCFYELYNECLGIKYRIKYSK